MSDSQFDMGDGLQSGPWKVAEKPLMKADIRRKQGRLMPGTLIPPSNSFLESDPPSPTCSQATEIAHPIDESDVKASIHLSNLSVSTSRPLVRSASVDAREDFLNDLDCMAAISPVSVYVVSIEDLPTLERTAVKVGFHTSAILSRPGETNALLIVGIDGAAVESLRSQLARDFEGSQHGTRASAIKTMASGAVAGAALLFTGLAFVPGSS